MKKIVVLLFVLTCALPALSAQDDAGIHLFITPGAYVTVGSENALRGFSAGLDVKVSLFDIIVPGVQALLEYDGYFNTANIPVMLQIGLGRNFWVGAGTTVALATPVLGSTEFQMGPFPNTYGLGFSIPIIPLGDLSSLKIAAQATYTNTTTNTGGPLSDTLNMIAAVFANLRIYVGAQLELGI